LVFQAKVQNYINHKNQYDKNLIQITPARAYAEATDGVLVVTLTLLD
jgi:hypothetical protein